MPQCKICQGTDFKKLKIYPVCLYNNKTYNLIRCRRCETVFTDPVPTKDELDYIYKNNYFYASHKIIDSEKRYRAEKLAGYIKRYAKVKKALDVGTMYGYLIKELAKIDIDCEGIETDKESAEKCAREDLKVENISVDEFILKSNQKYDLIVLSHVLEHLYDPKADLTGLKNKLNDGGKLLIIVPNTESFFRKLSGRYWGYWDVPVHLTHYNKNSLRYLLKSCHLEIINSKLIGGSSLLFFSTLAKIFRVKTRNMPMTAFKEKLIKLASSVLKYWYILGNDEILILTRRSQTKIKSSSL